MANERNANLWQSLGPYTSLLKLENVEFRAYQYNIINSVLLHGNTLVVLPTGLGKTFIGVAVIAHSLFASQRALLLAPTKPLCEQHYTTLKQLLNVPESDIALLLGSIGKKERSEIEQRAKVIVATPQTIANDLRSGSMSLDGFGVVVFDECHHAVGKYAYTYIANECAVKGILILGLTASPGSKPERVMTLVNTLNIRHIEVKTSIDPDVSPYVMPKYMHIIGVELSDTIKRMALLLRPVAEESLRSLRSVGLANFKSIDTIPKGRLIQLGDEIKKISAPGFKFGALFSYIKLLHAVHAYDLLTTEGIYPFRFYLSSLSERESKSRAVEAFLKNKGVVQTIEIADAAIRSGEEHPKVDALINILNEYKGKSAIVFAQYRSTIKMLVEKLNAKSFSAVQFVGKKEGVTQEQQKQTIADFRSGKFNILVASSIGEEGLDIPSVDLVVFYEPIPNEIRNIQRSGRTGRFRAGNVFVLFARGTKDEIYLYVSRAREKKMASLLNYVNSKLERAASTSQSGKQAKL